MSYRIRRMSRREIDEIAVEWAAAEGRNPGENDADCFYAADANGFWVGCIVNDDDDEELPIATISAVKYGTTFGFIGFYIVQPD